MTRLSSSLLSLIILVVVSGCASTRPAEDSADIIVTYSIQDDQLDAFLGMGMPNSSMPSALQEDMLAFIKKHLDMEMIRDEARAFYLENFTPEELQVIADYQATPAAQKALELAPQLATKSASHFQRIMVEHRDEFMEMMQKHMPAGARPPGMQN